MTSLCKELYPANPLLTGQSKHYVISYARDAKLDLFRVCIDKGAHALPDHHSGVKADTSAVPFLQQYTVSSNMLPNRNE